MRWKTAFVKRALSLLRTSRQLQKQQLYAVFMPQYDVSKLVNLAYQSTKNALAQPSPCTLLYSTLFFDTGLNEMQWHGLLPFRMSSCLCACNHPAPTILHSRCLHTFCVGPASGIRTWHWKWMKMTEHQEAAFVQLTAKITRDMFWDLASRGAAMTHLQILIFKDLFDVIIVSTLFESRIAILKFWRIPVHMYIHIYLLHTRTMTPIFNIYIYRHIIILYMNHGYTHVMNILDVSLSLTNFEAIQLMGTSVPPPDNGKSWFVWGIPTVRVPSCT